MEKETVIRPSLLSFDFLNLNQDRKERISLNIATCHYDVRDGHFVHDISFGEPLFKRLRKSYPEIGFDVHLRVTNPLEKARSFAEAGCKDITIHYEARTIGDLPKRKQLKNDFPRLKLGIALSPESKPQEIQDFLSLFDSVLIRSVVPGKGGQSFIEGSEDKIKFLSDFRKEHQLSYLIGVDGGINEKTGPICYENGADYRVAGSAYKKSRNKKETLRRRKGKYE